MSNLVRNPETGQPSVEVVSYEAVELSQLEGAVVEAEAALGQAQAEVERLNTELATAQENVSAKEAALSDAKSLVEQYHALVPTEGSETPDQGAEGSSGQNENGAEVQTEGEPVPVTVEVPQF